MRAVIALFAIQCLASGASAAERCPAATAPPQNSLAGRLSPETHEQEMQQRQMHATYEALLAAGAPESLACAAALNPEILRTIAPTYFGHPAR